MTTTSLRAADLKHLTDDQFRAMALIAVNGMSDDEAARELGITRYQLCHHITLGVERLRGTGRIAGTGRGRWTGPFAYALGRLAQGSPPD